MLFGTATMALLWVAARLLAPWPSGLDIPVVWPALLCASLLAWTQALTWMPYGLRGLRVIVAMLWLMVIDTIVLLALHFKAPEYQMVAFLAPQIPLAYLVARVAVARGRRGEVPDWRPLLGRLGEIRVRPRRRAGFQSPEHAQAWFEWRRHGWSLPALVAIVVPFELVLLFAAGETPALVFVILSGALLTPAFMAAFASATVSRPNPHASDDRGLTPFLATRPLTSPALIAAKLKVTMRSTLVAWLPVLVAIPLALYWSGTSPIVVRWARGLSDQIGTPRTIVLAGLVLSGLVSATWKQLVQRLYIRLSGRDWLIKANAVLLLAFLVGIGPFVNWLIESGAARGALWAALPWIFSVMVVVKMAAGYWVAARLHHSRLLSDRALVAGAAAWLVAVLALYGLFVWFMWGPFPRHVLALLAILAVPLARVSAAPLALAWNRHR